MIVNKIDFLYALQYALISRPNQHWLKIRIRHAVMVENIQQGNDCFDLRTHLLEASCFQFRWKWVVTFPKSTRYSFLKRMILIFLNKILRTPDLSRVVERSEVSVIPSTLEFQLEDTVRLFGTILLFNPIHFPKSDPFWRTLENKFLCAKLHLLWPKTYGP